jgi:hypothetical protein
VARYFQDAATLAAATAAFVALLTPAPTSPRNDPDGPQSHDRDCARERGRADALAELQNLPEAFQLHVLCSFGGTLGSVLEAVPQALYGHAVRANTERRRCVFYITITFTCIPVRLPAACQAC